MNKNPYLDMLYNCAVASNCIREAEYAYDELPVDARRQRWEQELESAKAVLLSIGEELYDVISKRVLPT